MWDSYREAFECDGSLRDIYVFNTNLNDWQKFFEFLEEKGYECKLNDRHYTLPLVAQSLFVSPDKESNLLTVNVNEVILCCIFSG